jgi:hypothetical protein
MKKNVILLILVIGFSATSCYESFLDQKPINEILTKDVFTSEQTILNLLPGAYQPMRWEFNPAFGDSYCMTYIYTDVRSDDVIIENKYFQPHSHGFEDFVSLTATNVNVQGIWAKFYNGVSNANQIIQGLLLVDEKILGPQKKAAYLAEARFLRGYYYFELVKNFGDVPLFGDKIADISDPNQVKRKPVADVYAQIESDLIEAAENLPPTQPEKYRATKGAALGILSKVYLFQEKWQLAAKAAQDVIDLKIYSLEENYGDNFKIDNEFGKESIFEIEYKHDVSGGNWNPNSQTSLTLQFFAPAFSGTTITGWSYNLITPELLAAFNNEGDIERRDATIMQEGHVFDSPTLTDYGYNPIETGWFDEWINSSISGGQRYGSDFAYSMKYFLTPEELLASSPSVVESTLNHKVLRYADILLVLAEATLHGAPGDGQGAFNEVRERAGLPAKTLTLDALKLERRLELATENQRFHDLVRWGDAHMLSGFTVGRDELLPIPVQDILLTGKANGEFILTQNHGY